MWNNFKVQDKISGLIPYIKDIETKRGITVLKEQRELTEISNKMKKLEILHAELQTATDK